MERKKCKDCGSVKFKNEFYSAQGECKECTKQRVRIRESKLREDPEWVEKERKRGRDKYHRLGYKGKYYPSFERKKEITSKHKEKYPEKYKAQIASQRIKKVNKKNHLHHWSYNEIHFKDCFELSMKDHNKLHRFLDYDKETFMYKNPDGILLDSKNKHEEFIKELGIKIYNH